MVRDLLQCGVHKCTHPEDGNLSPLIEAEFLRTLNLVCNFSRNLSSQNLVYRMQLNCSRDVYCCSSFFRWIKSEHFTTKGSKIVRQMPRESMLNFCWPSDEETKNENMGSLNSVLEIQSLQIADKAKHFFLTCPHHN